MEFLNWFLNPVLNQYADFGGRTSRKEFWMFVLVYFLLAIAVMFVGMLIRLPQLYMLLSFAVLVPNIAITARRLHDINMSGWWQLIGLIPFVGSIILIVLLVLPAKDAGNIYGDGASMEGLDGTQTQPVVDAEVVTQGVQSEVENTQQEQGR